MSRVVDFNHRRDRIGVTDTHQLIDFGCGRILMGAGVPSPTKWQQIITQAVDMQGYARLLKAPSDFSKTNDHASPTPARALMLRVKKAFDPQTIFASGNL